MQLQCALARRGFEAKLGIKQRQALVWTNKLFRAPVAGALTSRRPPPIVPLCLGFGTMVLKLNRGVAEEGLKSGDQLERA